MRRLLLLSVTLIPLLSFAHEGHTGSRTLEFVRNEGQWKESFSYKANNGESDIFLEKNGFAYVIGAPDNFHRIHDLKHNKTKEPQTLKYHAYKVNFVGGHTQAITGSKPQNHYYNYFLGNDPSMHKTGIHPVLAVDYKSVYDGIDVHIASQNGQMKYDFMVQPGADASQIKLKFEGTDGLSVKDKKLQIRTSVGTVEEMAPYAYQYLNGTLTEVACRYKVTGSEVSFSFPNGYDEAALLVIDPTVVFATYSGSTFDNWGFTATYDNAGNFYAGGIASNSQGGGSGYPTTIGAFQTTFAGGGPGGGNGNAMPCDMAISKYNPTGTAQIYATYIGGSDNDQPHSMIVDGAGNLIIAGRSYSTNYPTTGGCFDNTQNGVGDIVVTKLNATGSALVGSTFIGGSEEDGANISAVYGDIFSLKHDYGDDARSEVIVDNAGNVYVAASTQSTNFPTANATQTTLSGFQDGVVFKMDPNLTTLTWGTYLGGAGDDAAYVLALSPTEGHLYVAGGTTIGLDIPFSNSLFPNFQGGSADGYIVRFQNTGSYPLLNATYIGQSDYDQCFGIQVDDNGDVYAMGQTLGGTFPVTATYSNPGSSQFVIKLDPTLSTNIFSTVFGSGSSFAANISPVAFLVDNCQQIYISGWGGPLAGNGGNTFGMPVTVDAAQSTTDGSDFYFIVLSQNAQSLLYGSYMGSPSLGEHVDGGTSRFNEAGVIYQAICGGCGGSSTFPSTPGVFSPTNQSPNCNLVSLKIAFELAGVIADAQANNDTTGCAPLTVQFQNSSSNATTFVWDYGDGSPANSTNPNPSHTYNSPGTFIAMLAVENLQSCTNTRDTDYITIVVDSGGIDASFEHVVTDSCGPFRVNLTNTSTGSTSTTTYTWHFGDGSTFSGPNPGMHEYSAPGDYTITLLAEDPNSVCALADSMKVTVTMMGYVNAKFNVDDTGVCVGQPVVLGNASDNSSNVVFYVGNGDTLIGQSPVYQYNNPGTYTVMLVAYNPKSCNKSDTAYQTITVYAGPTADFIHAPVVPVPNEPIAFTNRSIDAIKYKWDFGDGEGSSEEHPSHLFKRTKQYEVCLQAENARGCIDTVCKFVDAIIHPALDVPTGFSPNGDGNNDILYVRGAAVVSVDFKVYNRWGQLVFESTRMDHGWDGVFKGKPQEMEVYAWTVYATFIDGSSASKSGNVTLMR